MPRSKQVIVWGPLQSTAMDAMSGKGGLAWGLTSAGVEALARGRCACFYARVRRSMVGMALHSDAWHAK